MRYVLYTASKSAWIREQADLFSAAISTTKGRGTVTIDVVYKKIRSVPTHVDKDGDIKPSWDWFRTTFPKNDYDGVIWHFTPYYRRKWVISSLGGARNPDNRAYPEFWVCADINDIADGYDISNLLRILFHEQAHFDEDLDDAFGNILTQNSVHDMDYKMKQIHKYHLLVDYRGQAIKKQIDRLIISIMKFAKTYI